MMFGFGDDQNPYTESVDLLEDLVIEYITETVSTSVQFLWIVLFFKFLLRFLRILIGKTVVLKKSKCIFIKVMATRTRV